MKAVMKSVSPRICEKVANGDCTILVSKTAPKCEVPFKGYIYCTSAKPYLYKEANPPFELFFDGELYKGKGYDDRLFSGKVIGEFVCDKVIKTCGWRLRGNTQQCAKRTTDEEAFPELACLTIDEIVKYAGSENREVCGWRISDLKIYDKPKELSEFERPCTYKGICYSCKRFRPNGIPSPAPYGFCETKITCAPQGWCYVEEL